MANSFKNLVKTGFGLGFGLYAAQIVFLLIGAAFFVPGYIMLQNKNKQKATTSEKMFPLFLMGIGALIMGGLGFGLLLDNVGEIFE